MHSLFSHLLRIAGKTSGPVNPKKSMLLYVLYVQIRMIHIEQIHLKYQYTNIKEPLLNQVEPVGKDYSITAFVMNIFG